MTGSDVLRRATCASVILLALHVACLGACLGASSQGVRWAACHYLWLPSRLLGKPSDHNDTHAGVHFDVAIGALGVGVAVWTVVLTIAYTLVLCLIMRTRLAGHK